MPDYLLMMHGDAADAAAGDWRAYIASLQQAGRFQGGSAIGPGLCVRKSGAAPGISHRITGYIRIAAHSLDDARKLLHGNPVFEAGGTVEIRELPETG